MEILNSRKLQELLEKEGEPCISFYMPTHPVGREQQQDPIRLKNLLSKASDDLKSQGVRPSEVETLLSPAQKLLTDQQFWKHQRYGLAIFITQDTFEVFRLPDKCKQLLVISKSFHIKPILHLISGDEYFYVLALSQNEVRLLQGSRFEISEMDLANTPTSLKEALWFDDPERQLQFHTSTAAPGSSGPRPSIFHGQGTTEEDTKTELRRFFQKVDHGMMDLLHGEQAPLVLAGVDYLLPIYQEVSQYPHLIDNTLTGNPDELSAKELHQKAWKLVEPIFQQDLHKEIERYRELDGAESKLASNKLPKIITAAHHGQIESLFVPLGVQIWGTYDEMKMTTKIDSDTYSGRQDLLDLAATQTILNGGKVFALEPEQMPAQTIAAIYRFSY